MKKKPRYYAFKYEYKKDTIKISNPNKIAGCLYSFPSIKQRNKWIEKGCQCFVPIAMQGFSEFRGIVKVKSLPFGWNTCDAIPVEKIKNFHLKNNNWYCDVKLANIKEMKKRTELEYKNYINSIKKKG